MLKIYGSCAHTLAIESSLTIASERHIGSTEQPRSGKILENNAIAVREPVRHVGAPSHFPVQRNVTVQEVGCIHDLIDSEGVVREDNTTIDATKVKSLQNRGGVVDRLAAVGECLWEHITGSPVIYNVPQGCGCS